MAVFLAVDTAHIQNLRIDHARAENLNPTGSLADAATFAVAVYASQIDFS